ncbi:hypothetical protein FPQ18DRAFT_306100 [Pyronema domesticum]|nr:hypothetical protein FPQ18DRAFT_306100 [Pyronema domesticum]
MTTSSLLAQTDLTQAFPAPQIQRIRHQLQFRDDTRCLTTQRSIHSRLGLIALATRKTSARSQIQDQLQLQWSTFHIPQGTRPFSNHGNVTDSTMNPFFSLVRSQPWLRVRKRRNQLAGEHQEEEAAAEAEAAALSAQNTAETTIPKDELAVKKRMTNTSKPVSTGFDIASAPDLITLTPNQQRPEKRQKAVPKKAAKKKKPATKKVLLQKLQPQVGDEQL